MMRNSTSASAKTNSAIHRKSSMTVALSFVIMVVLTVSAFSVQVYALASTVKKTTISPLQGGINPYKQSLVTTQSGPNAGWRVPRGKIGDLGYRPGNRPDLFAKTALPGLVGLIKQPSTITLRDKATIKHTKINPEGKYKSLVDALKDFDSQQKRRRH